jgi:thioesterase domain-containing protein/acyl carrier protein
MQGLMNALPSELLNDCAKREDPSAVEIRRWIVAQLAGVLNVSPESIDTSAPLHSLGASSLVAITMTGELAQWLDRDLPATLMWDHASIDALCTALGGEEPAPDIPSGIIALQPHGRRVPLFFFPGAGGHSTTFASTALHLAPEQPIYGLIVPGINGEREPLESVEDIVADMLEGVRKVQPRSPYQFAGYSFGGLLAFEAAQQMVAAGEEVALLAIYDTFTPKAQVLRPRWQRIGLHAYMLAVRNDRRAYIRDQLGARRGRRELRDALERYANAGPEPGKRPALQVEHANYRAAARYQPRPYPGVITLYRSAHRSEAAAFYRLEKTSNGWGAVAPGRVRVIELPGTHFTILAHENSQAAADLLRPYLATAT